MYPMKNLMKVRLKFKINVTSFFAFRLNDCSIAVGKATARASLQHLPALYPKDGSSLHVDEQLQLFVDGGYSRAREAFTICR